MSVSLTSVGKSFHHPFKTRRFIRDLVFKKKPIKKSVFRNLNLTIETGKKVLITGPNGCGKTTLLKMIAGLTYCDEGTISLCGNLPYDQMRKNVGCMLSTHLLYNGLTGYENLELNAYLFGCKDIEKRIEEEAVRWGAESFLDQKVKTYSNGMKAALAIARANIHNPAILLLDEPTAFLDNRGIERLMEFLTTTSQTVLITSQQPERLLNSVDRVLPLEEIL